MICGSISAHDELDESFRLGCSKEGRRAGASGVSREAGLEILALLLDEGFGSLFPGEERLRFLRPPLLSSFLLLTSLLAKTAKGLLNDLPRWSTVDAVAGAASPGCGGCPLVSSFSALSRCSMMGTSRLFFSRLSG